MPCSSNLLIFNLSLADLINTIFTLVYALELSINVVGYWFWDFIRSPWNVFDLIIVVMSLFDTIYIMAGAKG